MGRVPKCHLFGPQHNDVCQTLWTLSMHKITFLKVTLRSHSFKEGHSVTLHIKMVIPVTHEAVQTF